MGRRYYCDYCDKAFIDDIEARKKHLNSSLHQKLRKEHYLSCRDPKTLLNEEIVKQPCRRYFQAGVCPFLGNCKYTHYTQEELWQIKTEVDSLELQKQQDIEKPIEIPTLESWLEKYNQKKSNSNKKQETTSVWWNYPDILEMRPDLPPSLIKLKPEHFHSGEFDTWA